jgi:hypothetical protein
MLQSKDVFGRFPWNPGIMASRSDVTPSMGKENWGSSKAKKRNFQERTYLPL